MKSPTAIRATRLVWRFTVVAIASASAFAVWLFHPYPTVSTSNSVGSPAQSAFARTIANRASRPGRPLAGMIWIPGGEFSMGANDPPEMDEVGMKAANDARPIHRVYVDGFFMDKTDVTNEEFAKFVKATSYLTI